MVMDEKKVREKWKYNGWLVTDFESVKDENTGEIPIIKMTIQNDYPLSNLVMTWKNNEAAIYTDLQRISKAQKFKTAVYEMSLNEEVGKTSISMYLYSRPHMQEMRYVTNMLSNAMRDWPSYLQEDEELIQKQQELFQFSRDCQTVVYRMEKTRYENEPFIQMAQKIAQFPELKSWSIDAFELFNSFTRISYP